MNTYHHGDLRRQLLAQAATISATIGPESITLRELARRAGVSHSAPVHHFGTRQNLLTALAADGFEALNGALTEYSDDIHEMGIAYVLWAIGHPGHYAVMWRPRNLADDNEQLNRLRNHAWTLLSAAVSISASSETEVKVATYAAFAVVHGLAGIWLGGALPRPDDPEPLIREIIQRLHFDTGD